MCHAVLELSNRGSGFERCRQALSTLRFYLLRHTTSGFFMSCRAPFLGFTGRVLYEETQEIGDTRD